MKHILTHKTKKTTESFSATGEWTPRKGEKVNVRTADRGYVVRRVFSVGDKVVYLCSERVYAELKTGGTLTPPIGFPKYDVFRLEGTGDENTNE